MMTADARAAASAFLVWRTVPAPVRGELVPGPEPFEAEVLDADPRRVKRVKIYLRKDRRPAAARELPTLLRTQAARPAPAAAPPRDETNRPNPNTPRAP